MKNKIRFVVSLLFGLMMINSGLNKIFNYIPVLADMPEKMKHFAQLLDEIGWIMPLVAVVEILGGVLVVTNRYRALGALMLFPILIGILLTHIFVAPSGLPIALVLLGINLWMMWDNREKFARLF